MFYAGLFIHGNSSETRVAIVEKILRNAKREYALSDLRILPASDDVCFVPAVSEIHTDPTFLRKKKVFSQDRRPPKNTFTPPLIILAGRDSVQNAVERLREGQVPVEGFYFQEDPGWKRVEPKVLRFGTDLYVNLAMMEKLGSILEAHGGLAIDGAIPFAGEFSEERQRFLDAMVNGALPDVFNDGDYQFLPALFLALWHCETVKQIKRY
jgi:hypothetical protein